MTNLDADAIIAALALAPHPEGGWYRETFRDSPAGGGRGTLTQIYYLLRKGERSRWHRVDAVEVWHFYAGEPLALHIAEGGAPVRTVVLGTSFAERQTAHAVVPAHAWQAAEPLGAFTLVGCTVAPAFQFEGFELAPSGRRTLTAQPGRRAHRIEAVDHALDAGLVVRAIFC
jgi:uncharacterized protein